jgi:hypothetical protein
MAADYTYLFTGKEVTPWGGMVFLKQFLDRMGFSSKVASCGFLPLPGSNRGYPPSALLEAFVCSVWCGATKFIHTECTRSDSALGRIFGWGKVPAQDAYKRFFGKFTQTDNLRVADYFFRWLMDSYRYDNFTLDFDSSVLTRYGEQEGARRGYNSHKKGRASHHPLIAFVNDLRLVANFWLRSGDTASGSNFLAFLENTLEKLGGKNVSLVRLDSGFCSGEIMSHLEARRLDYIIAARFYHPIQRLIAGSESWLPLGDGIEICEKQFRAADWDKPRRIVIVRQRMAARPQAPGKTLSLFPEEEEYRNYRYSAYFTSLGLAPAEVWRMYRGRGDAENRIKEIKYDFGFGCFSLSRFYATEAALIFVMVAYNLMSIFRMFVLQESTQKRLSTLRWRTFAIGAYFQKIKGSLVLMIALTKKRRRWFDDLWNYPLNMPFFSNA